SAEGRGQAAAPGAGEGLGGQAGARGAEGPELRLLARAAADRDRARVRGNRRGLAADAGAGAAGRAGGHAADVEPLLPAGPTDGGRSGTLSHRRGAKLITTKLSCPGGAPGRHEKGWQGAVCSGG